MFLSNPPASHCVGPCRNCPCLPRFWKLSVAAFTTPPEINGGGYNAGFAILEAVRAGLLEAGGFDCDWHTDDINKIQPQGFFADQPDWRLSTSVSGIWGPEAGVGNVSFDEWALYAPQDTGRVAWPTPVVYTRFRPISPTLDNIPAGSDFHLFRCLRANRFYFQGGATADSQGDEDPTDHGFPYYFDLTPFYP